MLQRDPQHEKKQVPTTEPVGATNNEQQNKITPALLTNLEKTMEASGCQYHLNRTDN